MKANTKEHHLGDLCVLRISDWAVECPCVKRKQELLLVSFNSRDWRYQSLMQGATRGEINSCYSHGEHKDIANDLHICQYKGKFYYEAAGNNRYEEMMSTGKGLRAVTRWTMSEGLPGQFSLAKDQRDRAEGRGSRDDSDEGDDSPERQ